MCYRQVKLLACREGFVRVDHPPLGVDVKSPPASPRLDAVLYLRILAGVFVGRQHLKHNTQHLQSH